MPKSPEILRVLTATLLATEPIGSGRALELVFKTKPQEESLIHFKKTPYYTFRHMTHSFGDT